MLANNYTNTVQFQSKNTVLSQKNDGGALAMDMKSIVASDLFSLKGTGTQTLQGLDDSASVNDSMVLMGSSNNTTNSLLSTTNLDYHSVI